MKNDTLYHKIDMLPDVLKTEANTFIDYLLYKSNKKLKKKERKPGFLKGKISITSDFDDPLEEFKEYM